MDTPLNEATQDPPAPRAVPFTATSDATAFIDEIERLLLWQQEPIAILKLVAYATDAMRVLRALERHAEMSQGFADMLKSVCPDWRNPGSVDEPADVITVALMQVLVSLKMANRGLEQVIAAC